MSGDSKAREVKAVEPSSLTAFFIFNPTLGDEDTEGDKILYFYPPSVPIDIQKDHVGLTEGLIHFTREWGKPVDAVHCEKNRYALFEAEPDYWICLVAKNPNMTYAKPKDANAPPPKEITGKGPIAERMRKLQAEKRAKEENETEYLEDELEDAVLQAIIRRGYALYKLCNDRFAATAGVEPHAMCDGITMLRARLSAFMSYYLPTIRFKQLPFFTDIHGFQFMPVDKTTFLTIQYLVNLVTATFTNVKASALMYNSKLIWSGLPQDDMFLLYSLEQEAMRPFFHYLCYKDRIRPKRKHQSKGSTRGQNNNNNSNSNSDTASSSSSEPTLPSPSLARSATPEPVKVGTNGAIGTTTPMNGKSDSKRGGTGLAAPAAGLSGFLTGPNRNAALGSALPAIATSATGDGRRTIPLPSPSASKSRSAPVLYLSEYPNAPPPPPQPLPAGADPFEAMAAANAAAAAAAAAPTKSGPYTARLVAYQQANITLFFLIGDDSTSAPAAATTNSTTAAAAATTDTKTAPTPTPASALATPTPAAAADTDAKSAPAAAGGDDASAPTGEHGAPPPPKKKKVTTDMLTPIDDAAFERAGLFPADDSDVWLEPDPVAASSAATAASPATTAAAAASDAKSSPPRAPGGAAATSGVNMSPRPDFYTQLEQHMSGNLKKLSAMLQEQSTRSQAQDDQFRFLYFNHMNLALKTSLNAKQSPLTMEAIKLIRNIHADLRPSAPVVGSGRANASKPDTSEVCVKTASQGWVIGRRATQTHREFFVLLDEKVGTLSDVQDEVDKLAKTYFYNIFSA